MTSASSELSLRPSVPGELRPSVPGHNLALVPVGVLVLDLRARLECAPPRGCLPVRGWRLWRVAGDWEHVHGPVSRCAACHRGIIPSGEVPPVVRLAVRVAVETVRRRPAVPVPFLAHLADVQTTGRLGAAGMDVDGRVPDGELEELEARDCVGDERAD